MIIADESVELVELVVSLLDSVVELEAEEVLSVFEVEPLLEQPVATAAAIIARAIIVFILLFFIISSFLNYGITIVIFLQFP